ncbi:MAG: AI-2E family transporter [Methylovirgula sp.]
MDRHRSLPEKSQPSAEAATSLLSRAYDSGLWRSTQVAIIGTFLIATCAFLYFTSAILVPVVSAIIIGTVLGPLEKRLSGHRVPAWLFATIVVIVMFVVLQISAILLSRSIIEWVKHAAEFSEILRNKLQIFERGLAAVHELQKALGSKPSNMTLDVMPVFQWTAAFLTPTLAELLIFFATLFFYLLGRDGLRRQLVMVFEARGNRLRALRIINDVEGNLARYFATVTIINAAVGLITFIGTWMLGLANPALFGILAFACNYIPYIGPAFVVAALFAAGIVSLPTLAQALWAPLLYVTLTTIEGNLLTPRIVGRRLTLNPFAILLGLTFWTWIWGPIGAFLSVPFLIIVLAIREHVSPDEDPDLPV